MGMVREGASAMAALCPGGHPSVRAEAAPYGGVDSDVSLSLGAIGTPA